MRDPMSWALPIFRAFGIQVRVHLLFFIVTLGFFLRQISQDGNIVWWGDIFLFTIPLLFGIILLHEFGHCFGARSVDGEADDILIWPLGGLAFVQVPQRWGAHTWTTFCGPLVNLILCALCAVLMAIGGYLPSLNPFHEGGPFVAKMHNFQDGRTYTSEYGLSLYVRDTDQSTLPTADMVAAMKNPEKLNELVVQAGYTRAEAPLVVVWLYRTFWLSWILFLFNMIPAYPLDGGKLLQGLVWWRTDYNQGVSVAVFCGYICAVLFLIAAIGFNEALLMGLAIFMLVSCWQTYQQTFSEDRVFGYDFSAGYSSLEKDEDEAPRKVKRPGMLTRWLQARTAKRLQREKEQRRLDDERMDQLLEKIAQFGKESLSAEEKRFMEQVSARYRKS